MKQINKEEINGKTIKDSRFYEDYITILFNDDTFCHLYYDFDYDEGKGFWDDMNITDKIDENGNVLPSFMPSLFWFGYTKNIVPNDNIRGLYELGIIKCNEDELFRIINENNKRVRELRKKSFLDLAQEFGVELTEVQLGEMDKILNKDLD